MESVTFALPTLGSTAMSRDDQNVLVVNQATAVIVAAWLEHKSVGLQTGKAFSEGDATDDNDRIGQTITEAELASVINSVQVALRS